MTNDFHSEYICTDCAEERGGRWPEGHAATWHEGECEYCHTPEVALSNIGDWNWPDKRKRGMRD